jgi:hypothetical protein
MHLPATSRRLYLPRQIDDGVGTVEYPREVVRHDVGGHPTDFPAVAEIGWLVVSWQTTGNTHDVIDVGVILEGAQQRDPNISGGSDDDDVHERITAATPP